MGVSSLVKCRFSVKSHDIGFSFWKINESARQKFHNASYVLLPEVRHFYGQCRPCQYLAATLQECVQRFEGNFGQISSGVLEQKSRQSVPLTRLDPRPGRFCAKIGGANLSNQSSWRWLSTVTRQSEPTLRTSGNMHRAIIAFGSNIGDRISYIEDALESMRAKGLNILKISRLYETTPMYYQNQDSFLNGVVLVETQLPPISLLDTLQEIEIEHGRKREVEKGPRTLDLDIILYGEQLINVERLKVPHPGLLEREFVLRPLADVVPNHHLRWLKQDSDDNSTIEVKSALTAVTNSSEPMFPITHIGPSQPPLVPSYQYRRTHVMSILNITPDSFSDGGSLSPADPNTLTSTVRSHISAGATILDIGGQSTRPNAAYLSASEELDRVLPVLRHIKKMPEARTVSISLDTFHSSVAETCAAENLIDIINDVSAGQMDPQMLRIMAKTKRTVILMHMRGTPSTMNKLTQYPQGVVRGVADELSQRVIEALEAGIAPWRIILDSGIGFAKTIEQNLELLKVGSDGLVKERPDVLSGYPWLIGTSRKGFIGKITGVKEAKERVWGTGASVTAAVAGGADIVRVHDVAEMKALVTMADAIYRGHPG